MQIVNELATATGLNLAEIHRSILILQFLESLLHCGIHHPMAIRLFADVPVERFGVC
jgi:hypothetical protein